MIRKASKTQVGKAKCTNVIVTHIRVMWVLEMQVTCRVPEEKVRDQVWATLGGLYGIWIRP